MFKASELFRKEKDKEDAGMLKFIKSTLDFFIENKSASIITHITHTSMLIWTLAELVYFFMFPSLQFLLDYGYSFFALSYVYLFIILNYIQKKKMNVMDSFMMKHFWNLNCCGPEMSKIISKRAQLWKTFGIIQLVIALINGVLFLPHESDRTDLFFILMLLERYCKTFYLYYRFVFFICLSWGAVIVITYPNAFAFYIIHLDFQYKLLTKHIENIEMGLEKNYSRQKYHEEIKRRLHFCVLHFQKLMEFRELYLRLLIFPIFLMLWIGLGVSIFLSYHLILMKQHNNILALGVLWLTVGEVTIHISILGQRYVDLATDFLHTLNESNWYEWNNSNMKTFLHVLMYAQTYKSITAGGFIPINFAITVWMCQKTASAFTFFKAIRRKHDIILN